MSVTSKQIERFKEEQEKLFNDVGSNRNNAYDNKITRREYLKARIALPTKFAEAIITFVTPTRTDFSWIISAAAKTLIEEEKCVPFKIIGLTRDEFMKLCLLEIKYAVELIDKMVEYNFREFIGTDYKHEMLQDGWLITDFTEDGSETKFEKFDREIKRDFKTAL